MHCGGSTSWIFMMLWKGFQKLYGDGPKGFSEAVGYYYYSDYLFVLWFLKVHAPANTPATPPNFPDLMMDLSKLATTDKYHAGSPTCMTMTSSPAPMQSVNMAQYGHSNNNQKQMEVEPQRWDWPPKNTVKMSQGVKTTTTTTRPEWLASPIWGKMEHGMRRWIWRDLFIFLCVLELCSCSCFAKNEEQQCDPERSVQKRDLRKVWRQYFFRSLLIFLVSFFLRTKEEVILFNCTVR